MTDAEKIRELQEQIKVLKRSIHLMCKFGSWDDCGDCPCYDPNNANYCCQLQSAGLGSPTLYRKGKDF